MKNNIKNNIESIIFGSKWLLIPFYLVLILTLAVYTIFDIKEFIEYVSHINKINKETAMITFIELIDVTMIGNLGVMIITGSYNSFVSKTHGMGGESVSSGMLKVKMATSLAGVTAIGLLQKSLDIASVDWNTLYKLAFVHGIFLLSSIVLSIVDYLHELSTHKHQPEIKKIEHEIQENIHQGSH